MTNLEFAYEFKDELEVGYMVRLGAVTELSGNRISIDVPSGVFGWSQEEHLQGMAMDAAVYYGVRLDFCAIKVDILSDSVEEIILEF